MMASTNDHPEYTNPSELHSQLQSTNDNLGDARGHTRLLSPGRLTPPPSTFPSSGTNQNSRTQRRSRSPAREQYHLELAMRTRQRSRSPKRESLSPPPGPRGVPSTDQRLQQWRPRRAARPAARPSTNPFHMTPGVSTYE